MRLEEVAKAVGGGYCRLQMPLKLALGVRGTAAGHRLGALKGTGGPPPHPMHSWGRGGGVPCTPHGALSPAKRFDACQPDWLGRSKFSLWALTLGLLWVDRAIPVPMRSHASPWALLSGGTAGGTQGASGKGASVSHDHSVPAVRAAAPSAWPFGRWYGTRRM